MHRAGLSETGLLFEQIKSVARFDTCASDSGKLLGLDHVDSVPLLVDDQAIFLALDHNLVLVGLADLLIFGHLLVELLLVLQVGVPAICHDFSLLLLLLPLSLNHSHELVSILLFDLLQTQIIVGKLSLACNMQLLELSFIFLPL